MKKLVRKLIPQKMLSLYRKFQRTKNRKINQKRTTEDIFSEIYKNNQWGGENGEFNSGGGTTDMEISKAYLNRLQELGTELNFSSFKAVDLGCGDMRIGSQVAKLFSSYVGVDIVKDLIEHHKTKFDASHLTFQHINMIEEELPDGDVCFIRQVLQHLGNDQIVKILSKLSKYKYVIITEHLPSENKDLKYNLDKPHGADVRLYDNSGIYLDKSPFNIDNDKLETILEVEGHGYDNYDEPWIRGVIQTVIYTPGFTNP